MVPHPRSHTQNPAHHLNWLPLIDIVLAAISAALWYNWPALGALPLAIALLPWALRLLRRQAPFHRTPYDLLILSFLLTAGVGVWAAYDRELAWTKFWLIVEAVLLYYAFARQPRANLFLVSLGLGLFGSSVAGYFLLTNDWSVHPAKVQALNRIGLRWMQMRPTLNTHALHPNVASGITALTFPLLVALSVRFWRQERWAVLILPTGGIVLSSVGLLLGTSRGAILALGLALVVWAIWELSGSIAREARWNGLFFLVLGTLMALGILFVLLYPGGPLALANKLPGPPQAGTRVDIVQGTLNLIADFPIIGSGLNTFPALYSQYILLLPYYILDHGHNLFLDITLQQGIPGGIIFTLLVLSTLWDLFNQPPESNNAFLKIRWGAIASLLVMILHGLMDDVLYGSRGALLILVPMGIGIALIQNEPSNKATLVPKMMRVAGLVIIITALALAAGFHRRLLANWNANLGALQMARVELVGWPSGEWDDGTAIRSSDAGERDFQRALQWDPSERTAHHRLGLIALLSRDFSTALHHLKAAHQLDPQHRGIRKALGYSYAWVGQYASADQNLASIPEAQEEMRIYIWWWRSQDREDLSNHAAQMVEILEH